MRAVVQRVAHGQVTVDKMVVGKIDHGLVVLLGVGMDDTEQDADYLADKIANLRIFEDDQGKMNRSCLDIDGQVLAVSQFTLFGDCRRGRRPSFSAAAQPERAVHLYQHFVIGLQNLGLKVETGQFQTTMLVEIANDGPVTMLLDSKRSF